MKHKQTTLSLMGLFTLCFLLFSAAPIYAAVQAAQGSKLAIELLSPSEVKEFPGAEKIVQAKVTNLTDQMVPDVMAYITLADLGKHMTVNLEDYSADKPVVIGSMQPKESKTVELPIRFVYTSRYLLYVTAVSSGSFSVQSSGAVPVEILSNSNMDPAAVEAVTFGVPLILFIVIAAVFYTRWNKRKQRNAAA
jgi:hypothetical protein